MKRLLIFLFIAILTTLPAAAQVGEQHNDLSLGVNAALSLNQVGFTPRINQLFYLGPTAGVTLRYTSERYLGMYCAFQAEVNFAQLGWREDIYSYTNEKLPDTYQRNLSYIQVPVMANLGFGKLRRGFKGYLVAGPQVSYLIGEKEKRSETWTMINTVDGKIPDRTNNVTKQYGKKVENAFEYGITAGLGAEYSSRIGHFCLEGRYYMGLSNLFANSKKDPFPKSNNGTIVVKVTYLFDLPH